MKKFITIAAFLGTVLVCIAGIASLGEGPTTVTQVASPHGQAVASDPLPPDLSGAASPTVTLNETVIVGRGRNQAKAPEKKYVCGTFRPLTMGTGSVKECEWR